MCACTSELVLLLCGNEWKLDTGYFHVIAWRINFVCVWCILVEYKLQYSSNFQIEKSIWVQCRFQSTGCYSKNFDWFWSWNGQVKCSISLFSLYTSDFSITQVIQHQVGKMFLSGTLRNQLQPAVRCYLRVCMEGMKRTVINIRVLAFGMRIKSEIPISIAISKFWCSIHEQHSNSCGN